MNSLPFSAVVISYATLREILYLQVLRNALGLNSYLGHRVVHFFCLHKNIDVKTKKKIADGQKA